MNWLDWLFDQTQKFGAISGVFSLVNTAFSFLVGFFASRFTMTRKESKDLEQKYYENGRDLLKEMNDRFQEFTSVLAKYASDVEAAKFDDFLKISTTV